MLGLTAVTFVLIFINLTSCIYAAFFKPITVDDIEITERGKLVSNRSDTLSCSLECVFIGDDCLGFHLTRNSLCYLLLKKKRYWNEKAARQIVLWLRLGVVENASSCLASEFKITRGRSRYKLEKQKLKWKDAAEQCVKLNSKLVQLTTNREKSFLQKYSDIQKTGIGLHKDEKDVYRWHRSNDAADSKSCKTCDKIDVSFFQNIYDTVVGFFKGTPKFPFFCECPFFW